jgi:Cu/Ag efflux pump CusA
MISCRYLHYTYGGMYYDFFRASSSCGSVAFVISVVLLGYGGGVLALFVRRAHAGRARQQVSVLFLRWLSCRLGWLPLKLQWHAGCAATFEMHATEESQAKFRAVSLVGLCAIVGVLPLALIGESSGAQGRFATVMLGGVLFSTIAALTVLPVVIP